MKKFYSIGLGIAFFGLAITVNGQKQQNELTGISTGVNSLKSSTIYDLIRLKIENQYVYDAAVIYYYDTFSDGYGREDSDKMFNSSENVPEIFTRIGNAAMAINGFYALDGRHSVSVAVSVRNRVWDKCEITAILDDFTDEYDVVLEDVERGHYTNMRTSSYTYTPAVLGVEHDRFVLHLSRISKVATGIDDDNQSMDDDVLFYSDSGMLQVTIDAVLYAGPGPRARIDVFNRAGKKMISRSAVSGLNQIELESGQIYIVSVTVGNKMITKKVAVI